MTVGQIEVLQGTEGVSIGIADKFPEGAVDKDGSRLYGNQQGRWDWENASRRRGLCGSSHCLSSL